MKNLIKTIGVATLALTLGLTSCGGSKPGGAAKGEELLELHCQAEGKNTKEHFAAFATGKSMDMETARKKAATNVRAKLAASINTTVQTVTDNYVNSVESNNKEELMKKYQSNTREIVNQELKGLNTTCEKITKNGETGEYTCYVAMELSGGDLLNKFNQGLSQDEVLKVDYNYEKFKETFDAEMAKAAGK